jgi:hypothetical protein
MPALTFPYKRLGPHYAPVVPVALFGRSLSAQTEAYVDSGAFASIFRLGLLAALGLRKEDGRVETFTVGDGGRLKAYAFRLPVQIGPLRFVARATFSDELRIGFNLLGRQTIFDRFDEIAFNERARQVIFRFD